MLRIVLTAIFAISAIFTNLNLKAQNFEIRAYINEPNLDRYFAESAVEKAEQERQKYLANHAKMIIFSPDGVLRPFTVSATNDQIDIQPDLSSWTEDQLKIIRLNWETLKSSQGSIDCVKTQIQTSRYTIADEMRDLLEFRRFARVEIESARIHGPSKIDGVKTDEYFGLQEDKYIKLRKEHRNEVAEFLPEEAEVIFVLSQGKNCLYMAHEFSEEFIERVDRNMDMIQAENHALSVDQQKELQDQIRRLRKLAPVMGGELGEDAQKTANKLEQQLEYGKMTAVSIGHP